MNSPTTEISAQLVKQLREQTGAGMMECKKALQEANGSLSDAIEILRKRGAAVAAKKATRHAREGIISSYIHMGGKVGVLVEINCETDFVAKNDTFREFAKDITLQIAAANPLYISRSDVPEDIINKEKEIILAQLQSDPKNAQKPAHILNTIVEGKLERFYQTTCLLDQTFIKDPDITIQQLLNSKIQEIGENIVIRRFVRFQVGETQQAAQT